MDFRELHREPTHEYVEQSYVRETLSIYRDEFIYLASADVNDRKLTAALDVPSYPLVHDGYLQYLTAPLTMLIVSQIGYLFTRLFLEAKIAPEAEQPSLNKGFFDLRDEGRILISSVRETSFREKIPLPDLKNS